MTESILNGKKILAVDDEPDILDILEDEILAAAPECGLEKVMTYDEAAQKLNSQSYDLVILDIMGVRGFELLEIAVQHNFPTTMLTARSLNPESLKRSIEMKARAFLPKEMLGETVPFLEDILEESDSVSGWDRLMNKLQGLFNSLWGDHWQKQEERFWNIFGKKTSRIE